MDKNTFYDDIIPTARCFEMKRSPWSLTLQVDHY
ncbi:uncharacterized protein METZ01_LOCUS77760 [marine metagenome]|uniref:Uncharacterized protein n=1 Tax=marine metagenome TaxID=408172 RepID=A0A381U9L1_9ZZZZ